jgi:hypothetical protein
MPSRALLKLLFAAIFIGMLAVTSWASLQQSMFSWGGLTGPDRAWTIATLADAYGGFITFYVYLYFREHRALPRILWFLGIMTLGNMAMSAYMLIALARLKPDQSVMALWQRETT